MPKLRLGFVPLHRYPFDEDWAVAMRQRCLEALRGLDDIEVIVPGSGLVHNGLVRDDASAQATIDLFAQRDVQGIILGTMTFGDEIAAITIAEALDLPVLAFGTKEGPFTADGKRLSDAFCGTLSVTSGLFRHKIPYRFAGIVWPEEADFLAEVNVFAQACSGVAAFMGARIAQMGLRPERFETCTANEVAMNETFGQRLLPISLPEVFAKADNWPASDHRLPALLAQMAKEADCTACVAASLDKMARLELALQDYFVTRGLDALAGACWNDVQERYGICACSTFGRLTAQGMLVSCESDVYGALTMLAQYGVAQRQVVPHFIDWTIQHQQNDNIFLAWHCGNAPGCLAANPGDVVIREQAIMSMVVGADKAEGAGEFQLAPGVVTLSRLVEYDGEFKMLITNGEIVASNDRLRGSWAWVRVPDLKLLYRVLAEQGFTHHASMIHGDYADALEAFCAFAGIEVVRL